MKSIKKLEDDKMAEGALNNIRELEGRDLVSCPLASLHLGPSIVEQSLEGPGYVTLSSESAKVSTKDYDYGSRNESPKAGQGICLGSDLQEGIGGDGIGAANTAVGASWPDQPKRVETRSTQTNIWAQLSDDGPNIDCIDPVSSGSGLESSGGLFENRATAIGRMFFVSSDTDKNTGFVSPKDRNVKAKQETSGKEPSVGSDLQYSQISITNRSAGVTRSEEPLHIYEDGMQVSHAAEDVQENQKNHISFKVPTTKIADPESFGFSFSPRFGEKSSPVRVSSPRQTLGLFEDIEKQGRCSLLNHPRSSESSRHHSRGSTMGLQEFGILPIAMKTSKETGDQPPILATPPYTSYLSDDIGALYGPSGVNEAALDVGFNALIGDGVYIENECEDEGSLGLNSEPPDMKVNIEDYDIVISTTKVGMGGKYSPDTSSTSDKDLHCARKAYFAVPGAGSTWISSHKDREKETVEANGGDNTYYVNNSNDVSPPQN